MLILLIGTFRHTVKTMCKNVLVFVFNMTVHMEIQSSVWESFDVSIVWGRGSKLNDVIPWELAKLLCRLILRDLSIAPFITSFVRVFMSNTLSPIDIPVRKNYTGWNLVTWFWQKVTNSAYIRPNVCKVFLLRTYENTNWDFCLDVIISIA